jgi:hypothetical protein
MARSFGERQVTEEIIDKEHRNVCIRWPNSSPCRIGLLLESRIQGRLFGSCRLTRHPEVMWGPGPESDWGKCRGPSHSAGAFLERRWAPVSGWPAIWTQLPEAAGGRSGVALFRAIAPHDSAPICSPLPWSSHPPRATGRPLDENTQYGIRQFSARSSNQKTKSISLDKISH